MKLTFVFIITISAFSSLSQSSLLFEITNYNFGEIHEEKGYADYTFLFINSGDDSIQITNVLASCGCTTPSWTKEKISPGDSGYVTVRFNPFNRPGTFTKSLLVSSTGGVATLYISGSVKPKPRTIEDELPTMVGGMRVKYKSFNMGRINTEKIVIKSFEVYNDLDTSIVFMEDQILSPDFIKVAFNPVVLKGKEKGLINITYDPIKRADFGYVVDGISIVTTDSKMPVKDFAVIATIEEYFASLGEDELAVAPKLVFDKTNYDFGRMDEQYQPQTTFTLSNIGKQNLLIRTVKSNCDCITVKIDKQIIEPGESTVLNIGFNPKNRRGRQFKTVTVFSNDPASPTQVISINAEVKR